MSRSTAGNNPVPTNLKETLIQLEGTINEWENISPDESNEIESETQTRLEHDREVLEKELQKKARVILDQLKNQIEELSE
jgi:hypothetical protein